MHHDCFVLLAAVPDGNPGGSEEREVAGYGSDGSRHNRRYNTFFCHCFRSDIHIFLPAESAPDLRSRYLEGIYSPVIALGGYSLSYMARLMRSSLLEVMGQDYIRTARAKGLSETKVVLKHAMRNALIPVITVLGPTVANLMTGAL